jgi:hypothetical protein
MNIPPVATLAAAPFARFAFSREPYSAQNHAALFANFARVNSVLREEFVTLLSCEQHGYFSPSRESMCDLQYNSQAVRCASSHSPRIRSNCSKDALSTHSR